MSECWHDFKVSAVFCDNCWEQEQQALMLVEMRRANDLKEEEIKARAEGNWQEPDVRFVRPRYNPPPRVKDTGKEREPKDERNLFG